MQHCIKQQTFSDASACVAIHCLHSLAADVLSLNPPRAQLAGLSADIVAIVPKSIREWFSMRKG
jgi:hypothetical protein